MSGCVSVPGLCGGCLSVSGCLCQVPYPVVCPCAVVHPREGCWCAVVRLRVLVAVHVRLCVTSLCRCPLPCEGCVRVVCLWAVVALPVECPCAVVSRCCVVVRLSEGCMRVFCAVVHPTQGCMRGFCVVVCSCVVVSRFAVVHLSEGFMRVFCAVVLLSEGRVCVLCAAVPVHSHTLPAGACQLSLCRCWSAYGCASVRQLSLCGCPPARGLCGGCSCAVVPLRGCERVTPVCGCVSIRVRLCVSLRAVWGLFFHLQLSLCG